MEVFHKKCFIMSDRLALQRVVPQGPRVGGDGERSSAAGGQNDKKNAIAVWRTRRGLTHCCPPNSLCTLILPLPRADVGLDSKA